MDIKIKALQLTLDNYKRNIQLVCKDTKALQDMIDVIVQEWIKNGFLYRVMDKDTKLIIENRVKYSDGESQVPMLVLVDDLLDISWLTKIQNKAQVQMLYCTKEDIKCPNFEYKIYHDFDRFWNSNGRLFKAPILEEKGVIIC